MLQTPAAGPRRPPTKDALVGAAERLIAENGVRGVSMRQIATAAGQHNAGVIQYHFGDLDGLLDAILLARLPAINARRHELLAEAALDGRADDLHRLVEAIVLPLAEVAEDTPYVAFLARLLDHRGRFTAMGPSDPALVSGAATVSERIDAAVPGVPARVLRARLLTTYGFAIHTLGLRYRADEDGWPGDGELVGVVDLVEMLSAALAAPHARPSRRAP